MPQEGRPVCVRPSRDDAVQDLSYGDEMVASGGCGVTSIPGERVLLPRYRCRVAIGSPIPSGISPTTRKRAHWPGANCNGARSCAPAGSPAAHAPGRDSDTAQRAMVGRGHRPARRCGTDSDTPGASLTMSRLQNPSRGRIGPILARSGLHNFRKANGQARLLGQVLDYLVANQGLEPRTKGL